MKVDEHISELLYDYDCVIVPSFGGFLASYNSARIHPTRHTFSPPSKKIAFNVFLKENDGLLAKHISSHEKLSYTDALNQIERHVNSWQRELSEGRKLIVERVGTFYLDQEKNLQFDPVKNINYLRDAFGLSRVQFLPVKREENMPEAGKQVKEVMTIRSSERQPKTPLKLSKKIKERILTTFIISGTLIWLSFNLYLITPNHLDLNSLNPFSKEGTEVIKQESKPVTEKTIAATPSDIETVYVASGEPVNPPATTSVNEEKAEVKPDVAPPPPVLTEDQKYFLIGGAFELQENADGFVKKLQAEGFSDARILDSTRRLKMVCLKGFGTRAEAVAESENLKAANKDVWVYKQ